MAQKQLRNKLFDGIQCWNFNPSYFRFNTTLPTKGISGRGAEVYSGHTEKTKSRVGMTRLFEVALEGLEPSLKVPETCVLPLHHKAMFLIVGRDSQWLSPLLFPFDTAKLVLFSDSTKFFSNFFSSFLSLFSFLFDCQQNIFSLTIQRGNEQ